MSRTAFPGKPPLPPANLDKRKLPIGQVAKGTRLHRIHRSSLGPLYFGRNADPVRRQRWDAPDASYGVCYLAVESHIAFAETLLRDLTLETVHQDDLDVRSMALVEVVTPLRVVEMNGRHLHRLGADAAVVHASYDLTWAWSAALHAHPDQPDGIRYCARHDDSGFSIALFERAMDKIRAGTSIPLHAPSLAPELALWLDRYQVGLTS